VKKPDSIAAKLLEIRNEDIGDASTFLNKHMNDKFSSAVWAGALQQKWLSNAPNCGFMLRDSGNEVVGVLCAIYSQQLIQGRLEPVCNLHSWREMKPLLTKSILLVLAAIRQKGFHFTMFTPNQSGLEIFSYLKFKPLNSSVVPLLHTPRFRAGRHISVGADSGGGLDVGLLSERDQKIYNDHASFSWLDSLVFRAGDSYGFILYRRSKYKKLPSARIYFISDRKLFFQCWGEIKSCLLLKHKLFSSIIEARFLPEKTPFSLPSFPSQRTFYLSETLGQLDIECIYSELMVLDL